LCLIIMALPLNVRRWHDELNGGDDTLILNFNIGVERLEAEFFLAALLTASRRLTPSRFSPAPPP
jgi:hypothetical protein